MLLCVAIVLATQRVSACMSEGMLVILLPVLMLLLLVYVFGIRGFVIVWEVVVFQ